MPEQESRAMHQDVEKALDEFDQGCKSLVDVLQSSAAFSHTQKLGVENQLTMVALQFALRIRQDKNLPS